MDHRLGLRGVPAPPTRTELTLVIPVYNGSRTISPLVEQICFKLAHLDFEIVLVNDGSADDSEQVCANLVERYPDRVVLLQLTRNFGEHNAVMAGMRHACGNYLAILDDDGQNTVEDVEKMYRHAKEKHFDVVYSRYRCREHPWLRIMGSRLNDRAANLLLKKPRGLYLSSFKVMNRSLVDEVIRYAGPFPYIDGLILRISRNIGQLDVEHLPRRAGKSGYTLSKLVGLWLNMSVGFSLAPLRLSIFAGIFAIVGSFLVLLATAVNKIGFDPHASIAVPCLVAVMIFAIGLQLAALGIVGEYVGRMFLHQSGMPQNVVRYVRLGKPDIGAGSWRENQPGAVTG